MMEPLRSSLPEPGFLEGVKKLAHAHGAILIFDEVSCGWRLSVGGVQEYLGITPDMTVLAKAMSNGYPMGAVVGSREVMEPASRMFVSSSYWSDNIGLAAAITTIRELKRRNSAAFFLETGEKLRRALNGSIEAAGLSGEFTGLHTHPNLTLSLPDETLRSKVSTLFIQEMARRGVHCPMGFSLNMAHTDEDIRQTAEAASEAFDVIRAGLESDDIDSLLVCDLKQEPFRRLVS